MPQKSGANNRQFKNLFIQPGFQIRLLGAFLALMTLIVVGILTLFYATLAENVMSIGQLCKISPDIKAAIDHSLTQSYTQTSVLMIAVGLGMYFLLVRSTHRILGPKVPILRLVEQLKKGEYQSRGKLRKNDEYQDVMLALNELAESLEKKNSGR